MAVDEQRERQICEEKRYFGAEHLARDYAMLVTWKYPDGEALRAYVCPWCDGWHLTSSVLGKDTNGRTGRGEHEQHT